jgi:type VI secretion system secreted protein VgrG
MDLGSSASSFAVLAGAGITITGPNTITGNIGTSTTTITGSGTVSFISGSEADDATAAAAQNDLTTAYNTATGLTPTRILTGIDLGGLTLTPGVYFFSSSAQLTGTLTLNDQNNPDAVFVFQIGSTLTTASYSSVVTINGGSAPGIGVFWQVGSSATLGTGTAFEGNILAQISITANTSATDLDGRLLAETGAVTLDSNTITAPPVPETGSTLLLLGSGAAALFAFRRFFSLA